MEMSTQTANNAPSSEKVNVMSPGSDLSIMSSKLKRDIRRDLERRAEDWEDSQFDLTNFENRFEGESMKPKKQSFIDKKWFTTVVTFFICVNALVMGLETDHPEYDDVWKVFEMIFNAVFTWEMFSKLYILKLRYFCSGWNVMDFFLVWLSLIDGVILGIFMGGSGALGSISALRMLRVLRIVKMVRLLKAFRELWLIVKGMLDSIKTIFWASLLMCMLLYVAAIFCTQMIGKNTTAGYLKIIPEPGEELDYHPDFDAYQHFGTVPRAMFTLFETSLEPLNLRPVVEKQPYMLPFFLGFIFLTTFGVMNVIIGVIVDNTMQASNQTADDLGDLETIRKVDEVDKLRLAIIEMDANKDTFITLKEMKYAMETQAVNDLLDNLRLPIGTDASEFFALLNADGKDQLDYKTMLTHMMRNVSNTKEQDLLDLKLVLHGLKKTAYEGLDEFDKCTTQIDEAAANIESDVVETVNKRLGRIEQGLTILGNQLGVKNLEFPRTERNSHKYSVQASVRSKAADPIEEHHDDVYKNHGTCSGGFSSGKSRPRPPAMELPSPAPPAPTISQLDLACDKLDSTIVSDTEAAPQKSSNGQVIHSQDHDSGWDHFESELATIPDSTPRTKALPSTAQPQRPSPSTTEKKPLPPAIERMLEEEEETPRGLSPGRE